MREPWHKRRLRGEKREGWLARSKVLHMFSLMKELCGMHPSRRSDFSSRWTQTRSSCHTYSSDSSDSSFEFWRPRHRISSGWPRVESSPSICATLQAEGAKRSRFLRYAHSTDTLTRSTPSSSNGSIRSRIYIYNGGEDGAVAYALKKAAGKPHAAPPICYTPFSPFTTTNGSIQYDEQLSRY